MDLKSQIIDFDNLFIKPDLFDKLTVKWWGVVIIDKFASEKNRKTPRLRSKYICS